VSARFYDVGKYQVRVFDTWQGCFDEVTIYDSGPNQVDEYWKNVSDFERTEEIKNREMDSLVALIAHDDALEINSLRVILHNPAEAHQSFYFVDPSNLEGRTGRLDHVVMRLGYCVTPAVLNRALGKPTSYKVVDNRPPLRVRTYNVGIYDVSVTGSFGLSCFHKVSLSEHP
jgi:hypothetical protein